MLGDELGHLFDAIRCLQERLQVHRAFQDFVQFLDIADALGLRQVEELLLQLFARNADVVRRQRVVQR